MKLTQTQESIVPKLSVTDLWPQMQRKKCELTPQNTEIVFDAEKWIYERKSAYPMVDCIRGPSDGDWKHFNYHPVCNGVVLKDQDVLVLYPNGNYYVKPNTDQEGCAHHPSKCCECLLKEIDDDYLNYAPSDEDKHLKNADEAKHYATYLDAMRYAP